MGQCNADIYYLHTKNCPDITVCELYRSVQCRYILFAYKELSRYNSVGFKHQCNADIYYLHTKNCPDITVCGLYMSVQCRYILFAYTELSRYNSVGALNVSAMHIVCVPSNVQL